MSTLLIGSSGNRFDRNTNLLKMLLLEFENTGGWIGSLVNHCPFICGVCRHFKKNLGVIIRERIRSRHLPYIWCQVLLMGTNKLNELKWVRLNLLRQFLCDVPCLDTLGKLIYCTLGEDIWCLELERHLSETLSVYVLKGHVELGEVFFCY